MVWNTMERRRMISQDELACELVLLHLKTLLYIAIGD